MDEPCVDYEFIVGALNQDPDFNASCPFDKPLCLTEGVKIDTGFIDSAIDLGINAKPWDRVLYRKSISCAILNTDPPTLHTRWTQAITTPLILMNMRYFFTMDRTIKEITSLLASTITH